ncbi:hypothetical protein EVAR_11308_1 [Eumeta japonica]|uniref:Uncharacterized protein n=1 Tax=Eumeta variegata TaxID=151549 RepID=A0A4C1U117_EUMVA|nr:hypothetical protein EVAR_11308_1 [Eumeta japonica]
MCTVTDDTVTATEYTSDEENDNSMEELVKVMSRIKAEETAEDDVSERTCVIIKCEKAIECLMAGAESLLYTSINGEAHDTFATITNL